MNPPSLLEFFQARVTYWSQQFHAVCLKATGRCLACPGRWNQHKLGCSRRPGKGLTFSVYRKDS